MRVTVDRQLCCASGQCAMSVPEVFDQSAADGVVELLDPNPPTELHERVRQAACICPTGAISVSEQD